MAYQNMGTPRFLINEALWSQSNGSFIDSIFELNPTDIRTFSNESISLALDYNPTYIMLLGVSAGFVLTDDITTSAGSVISVNQGSVLDSVLAGFSLIDYPASSSSIILTLNGDLGALSIGRYYEMPHSPELSLTMSHEYKGVTKQTTMGGSTLTNINYYKPPKWGNLEAWQLDGIPRRYSGRRVWDLAFNYINDNDLEPSHYYMDETTLENTWKDNWFSSVLHYTNGGTLPFIFQPNKDDTYQISNGEIVNIPEFAICRFDMDTFSREQVAPSVYNIKVKIKEAW